MQYPRGLKLNVKSTSWIKSNWQNSKDMFLLNLFNIYSIQWNKRHANTNILVLLTNDISKNNKLWFSIGNGKFVQIVLTCFFIILGGISIGIECYGCDGSTPPCDATHHGYVFYCPNTDYCEVIYAGNLCICAIS